MVTKKTTTTKKAPVKKTAEKKAPVKKVAASKASSTRTTAAPRKKATKNQSVQSFRLVENPESFMTFRISRQTIYWMIFGVAVIALALWVANLQRNINDLYDQIDQNHAESQMLLPAEIEALRKQKELKTTPEQPAQ